MKKILKTAIITIIFLSALTAAAYFLLTKSKGDENSFDSRVVDEQSDQHDEHMYKFDTDSTAVELVRLGDEKNVLNFNQTGVFTKANSKTARDRLDRLIKRMDADFEKPIIAYNPFGTVPDSYYFYFVTPSNCMVRYTVAVPDEDIHDYIRYVNNGTDNNITTEHEFLVTGLVPGVTNYINLELVDENGAHREDKTYKVSLTSIGVPSDISYVVGRSEEKLKSGLFFMMPKKDKNIYKYDNNGIMRGMLATESDHGKRIYCKSGQLVYQISKSRVVRTDKLGMVTGAVSVSGVKNILDMSYDGYENVFSLAKDKKSYSLYRTSFESNKTKKIYTFDKGITPTSITEPSAGNLYVSTSAPAGIIRIDGLLSSKPRPGAVFGKKSDWKKTKLKKKVCDPGKKKKSSEEDEQAASGEAVSEDKTEKPEAKAFVGWDMKEVTLYLIPEESNGSSDTLSFAVEKAGVTQIEKIRLSVKKPSLEIIDEKPAETSGRVCVQYMGDHCSVVGCAQGAYEERDDLFKTIRQYGFIREFDGVWKLDLKGFSNL